MKFLERKKWLYVPRSQISGRFPLVLRNILRKLQNGLFVNQAKKRGLKLGKMLLDEQQVEAVVACEDAQLVLASAGSGKTMSLLAKIEYLHRELDIPAEKILAISFTKKTVEELIERCSVKNVEFRTFHALGNSILQEHQSEYLAKRRLISESQILEFLWTRLLELCKDTGFARMVNDYVLFYYSTPVAPGDFNNYSQKIRLNRLYLRSTILAEKMKQNYNAISKNHRATALNGEQVRNKEEELLANWLYIHQISYEYRREISGLKQRADFTIGDVYLDIFALDQNGNSLLGAEYQKVVSLRRKRYRRNKLKQIELHSWEWGALVAFERLVRNLQKYGINPQRRPELEILRTVQKYYGSEFERFLKQLATFLSLYKNGLHDMAKIRQRVARFSKYEKYRATLFLDIFERLFADYSDYLEQNRLYDFADMINDATELVRSEQSCMSGYEYILLDEVQDLSPNRLRLVREILQKNPRCRLFAVGDDWQSIYRFTGSNLELIECFESYFGRHVRRSLIETTHRFGSPTIEKSSGFVQKNPAQASKKVRGLRVETPIKIILSEPDMQNRQSELDGFRKALKDMLEVYSEDELLRMKLQIISRFNHDLKFIEAAPEIKIDGERVAWRLESGKLLRFEFCSIHKSKGITRDIVIVLNMNDDLMGMPAQRENDPLIDMLLSDREKYPFAEERRLFYVALTRARRATYLIAKAKKPSPFLLELSSELGESRKNRCPRCELGELIRKETKFGNFQYCSNYFYGCNYAKRIA